MNFIVVNKKKNTSSKRIKKAHLLSYRSLFNLLLNLNPKKNLKSLKK